MINEVISFSGGKREYLPNVVTMYNLMFEKVCLNKKPLTKTEAIEQMNLIIITYGYRPTLEKIS